MPVQLEALTGTLSDQGQTILRAMGEGALSSGQAVQILGAIAAQARILEVDAFAKRLEALEKRLGAANGHA